MYIYIYTYTRIHTCVYIYLYVYINMLYIFEAGKWFMIVVANVWWQDIRFGQQSWQQYHLCFPSCPQMGSAQYRTITYTFKTEGGTIYTIYTCNIYDNTMKRVSQASRTCMTLCLYSGTFWNILKLHEATLKKQSKFEMSKYMMVLLQPYSHYK